MKRTILDLLLMASAALGSAQTFPAKIQPSTAEDYVLLLESKGYKSYAVDITSLKDHNYMIEPVIQHYKDGKLTDNVIDLGIGFSTQDKFSGYTEEDRQKLIATGQVYDAEKDLLELCEKIRIGFMPTDNPLVESLKFYVTSHGAFTLPLFFDEQKDPETGEVGNTYNFRPFVVESIELEKFIPLAMCGVSWYDTKGGFFRFCGEEVLSEGMSEDILKSVPEYYIIGMKVHK